MFIPSLPMKPVVNVHKIVLGTIAILFATLLYLYTKLNYGYFSVITSFVLIQLFYSEIFLKIVERIIGPTLAFMITFCIIYFMHSYFIPYLIFSIIIVFLFAYYYAHAFYPYAMLWGLMTCALMSSEAYVSSPELGLRLGFYWVINIIIGSLVVLVTAFSIQPFKKSIKLHITKKKLFHLFSLDFPKKSIKKDYSAILIASRITLTVLFICSLNHLMGWEYVNIQAIIAGTVVSAQISLNKAHHKVIFRMTGVLLGSLFAILYVLILLKSPSTILEGVLIVSTLTICIFLAEKFPYLDYVFLQLGIVIPLILIHPTTEQYHLSLTLYRGFGSLEGGIIGTLMEYLFYFPLKKYQFSKSNTSR